MKFNTLIPELEISNLDKSLAFYLDLVRFELVYQREEEGFAFLKKGDAQLMLDTVGMGRTFDGGDPATRGRGVNFQIEINDLDAILARLKNANWPIFLPLEEKWYPKDDVLWGNRQIGVRDPDGYLLRLFENLGEKPA